MRFVLPLVVLLGWAGIAKAQKKEESTPRRNITVIVDIISVSGTDAFGLVRLDSAAMWAKVSEMVKAGTARSEYIASVTGVAGERHTIECLYEVRYPTEFEPPEDAGDWSARSVPPSREKAIEAMIVPNAYETRNVGSTMDAMAEARGEDILVDLISSQTILHRFISYPLGITDDLPKSHQPEFGTSKVQTKVLLKSGMPRFFGSGKMLPAPDGKNADKSLLFFVTALLGREER